MWPWIYRIIGSLLAAAGAALVAYVGDIARDAAARASSFVGQSLPIAAAVMAGLLLLSAVLILFGPASKSHPSRPVR